MSLNIETDETCILAGDLALLTGETMTGAGSVALYERWEREQRKPDNVSRTSKLRATAERCAALMCSRSSTIDHGELLDGERRPLRRVKRQHPSPRRRGTHPRPRSNE